MTVRQAVSQAAGILAPASDSPRLDAEILLAHVVGQDRHWLMIHADEDLDDRSVHRFQALVRRRRHHWPVAYLIGQAPFLDFVVTVTPAVLVPRPATELLVDEIQRQVGPDEHVRFADIGTGSGAIAIGLARKFPSATIMASDRSPAALRVARSNGRALAPGRIQWKQGSLLAPFERIPLQIIVANLPYLRANQLRSAGLGREPRLALAGGRAGLALIRRLIVQARARPELRGLVLECDPTQARAVRRLVRQAWPTWNVRPLSDGRRVRGLAAWAG